METLREYMNYNETINKIQINVSAILEPFAEVLNQYSISFVDLNKNLAQLRPAIEKLETVVSVYQAADKLAENQFVLTERIPLDFVKRVKNEDADALIEEYLISEERVKEIISLCGLDDNRVFRQSVDIFTAHSYDLAIIGFISVLDKVLADQSGQIKNVNIKSRCDAIAMKLEDKGDFFLDEMEGQDFLLFLTYPKVLELFGVSSDFTGPEPELLNRHWIMHGRTQKTNTRIDCVKILNMIYGTIRMGQLGMDDVAGGENGAEE